MFSGQFSPSPSRLCASWPRQSGVHVWCESVWAVCYNRMNIRAQMGSSKIRAGVGGKKKKTTKKNNLLPLHGLSSRGQSWVCPAQSSDCVSKSMWTPKHVTEAKNQRIFTITGGKFRGDCKLMNQLILDWNRIIESVKCWMKLILNKINTESKKKIFNIKQTYAGLLF